MDPGTGMIIASILSSIAPKVFGLLFGGGGEDKTQTITQRTETPPRGIQDPMLGLLLPYLQDTLLRGMSAYGGAGMPGGRSYTSPYGQDIMRILAQNWPALQQQLTTGMTTGRRTEPRKRVLAGSLGRA